MSDYSSLKRTVEKVVSQEESDFVNRINSSYNEALNKLRSSRASLESEYKKIIEDANKQAENLKRQIIGSSSIEARNRQLLVIEDAVNKVFEEVRNKIARIRESQEYTLMLKSMLEDAVKVINDEIIVECNKEDREVIKDLASKIGAKITLSRDPIDILGGLRARSKDGSIVYENTLERRIDRLRPLIKKDIVGLFLK